MFINLESTLKMWEDHRNHAPVGLNKWSGAKGPKNTNYENQIACDQALRTDKLEKTCEPAKIGKLRAQEGRDTYQFLPQDNRRKTLLPSSGVPLVTLVVIVGVCGAHLKIEIGYPNWRARILGNYRSAKRRLVAKMEYAPFALKVPGNDHGQVRHRSGIHGRLVDLPHEVEESLLSRHLGLPRFRSLDLSIVGPPRHGQAADI
jgi:hypothetical protein